MTNPNFQSAIREKAKNDAANVTMLHNAAIYIDILEGVIRDALAYLKEAEEVNADVQAMAIEILERAEVE